jgi:hypothetical protein
MYWQLALPGGLTSHGIHLSVPPTQRWNLAQSLLNHRAMRQHPVLLALVLAAPAAMSCVASTETDLDQDQDAVGIDGKADGTGCPSSSAALSRVRAAVRTASTRSTANAAEKAALEKSLAELTTLGTELGAFDGAGRNLGRSYYWLSPTELTAARAKITKASDRLKRLPRLASTKKFIDLAGADLTAQNMRTKPISPDVLRCAVAPARALMFAAQQFDEVDIALTDRAIQPLRSVFETVARDEESLWGDTILEGDYGLTGDAAVRSVTAMKIGQVTFAYQLHISASAVGTWDGCDYDDATDKYVGEGCVHGSIRVSRYVAIDGAEIETEDYADFEED